MSSIIKRPEIWECVSSALNWRASLKWQRWGGKLQVKVFDQNIRATLILPADYLVLAAAFRPSPGLAEAAQVYKLPPGYGRVLPGGPCQTAAFGFLQQRLFPGRHGPFPQIHRGGHSPGERRGSPGFRVLAKETMEISGAVAYVNPDDCARCLNCLRACPYGVPKFDQDWAASPSTRLPATAAAIAALPVRPWPSKSNTAKTRSSNRY